jgi:hypothetical protein
MKMFGALVTFLAAVAIAAFAVSLLVGPLRDDLFVRALFESEDSQPKLLLAGTIVFVVTILLLLRSLLSTTVSMFWEAVDENYLRHQAHMRSVNESRHTV